MSQARRWTFATTDPLPPEIGDPVALLGGKGASLRKLAEFGCLVPLGFTITTAACQGYFELGRQWPLGLMDEVAESVLRLERESGRTYGKPPSPMLLAVRSGAAVSMPGMLATLLDCGLSLALAETLADAQVWSSYASFIRQMAAAQNVELRETVAEQAERNDSGAACRRLLEQYERARGAAFPQDRFELLRQSISVVFDSWRQPRAMAFREASGCVSENGTGVTVQVMHRTDAAGVLFSRDPRDGRNDRLLIEAVPGSGRGLVEGTITPERHCLDRKTLQSDEVTVQATKVGPNAVLLEERQLRELARLGLDLEARFEHPVDVEWGCHDGELIIFQARPLAEAGAANLESTRRAEVQRVKRRAVAAGTRMWVRHNLSETLPSPTPLTWDIVRRWMSGSGGFGRLYGHLGYRPSARVCRHGFLDLVAGRIYADPDRVAEMFDAGLPLGYDLAELRRDPGLIDRAPTRFAPEKTDASFLLRLPGIVARLWRTSRRLRREPGQAAERFDRQVLPDYLAYIECERRLDLAALTDADVVARLEQRCIRVLDEFAAESLRPGLFGALAFTELEQRLAFCLGLDEGGRLSRALISNSLTETGPTQQSMLNRVAAGELSVADFLQRFGHRGPGEMELSAPRWREMPEAVAQAAQLSRSGKASDVQGMMGEAASARDRAAAELPRRLRDCGAGSLYPPIHKQLVLAQRLLPFRDIGRDYLMMGYDLIRQAIEELARRFDLQQDIYWLRLTEVRQLPKHKAPQRQTIARRRSEWRLSQRLPLGDFIEATQLDSLGLATMFAERDVDEYRGLSLSNGVARGSVQIAGEPDQARDGRLHSAPVGKIFVCPALDPGLAPMLMQAAGLIVERGGVLSHGAIVARQMGIPAVVVADALNRLRDGETVVVDGDRGIVSRQRGPS